jgi:CRISPR/Cas system-associated endonuclease Cas1
MLIVRNKEGNTKKYPYYEEDIEEVVLTSGNTVSTGALTVLGFWEVNVLVSTKKGQPIAVLKNLKDDSYVDTRVKQYEATLNGKGMTIARNIVASKCLGQNEVLHKYGLLEHDYEATIDTLSKRALGQSSRRRTLMAWRSGSSSKRSVTRPLG